MGLSLSHHPNCCRDKEAMGKPRDACPLYLTQRSSQSARGGFKISDITIKSPVH